MLKPSFFRKQKLNPKQKAILAYWQETKGVYVKSSSTEIVKNDQLAPTPPFNETEYRQLVGFDDVGELLEFYMWSQVLDALSLSDTLAQKSFFEVSSFIQIVMFGLPCGLGIQWQQPKFAGHDHKYYSWSLGKIISYDEGLSYFMLSIKKFFSHAIEAIMLNQYLDDIASPLPSQELLTNIFTFDQRIKQYMQNVDSAITTIFHIKGKGLVEEKYETSRDELLDVAEKEIKGLLQPLEVFYYSIQEDKLKEARIKALAILEQARTKSKLDIT